MEQQLLEAFAEAGFYGMHVVSYQQQPWAVVDGIELRSVTVQAFKGKDGPCLDHNQAVIYRGPFQQVVTDDGSVYQRGQRNAVCDRTFRRLQQAPYHDQFIPINPIHAIPEEQATEFDCTQSRIRDPRETKGQKYDLTILDNEPCCGEDNCC